MVLITNSQILSLKKVSVIGSGFAGLVASAYLAKFGFDVTVFEKLDSIGGRARKFKADGFTFDMGPSWYWMPEVFENFYQAFGYQVEDFYDLKRLDPSYQIFYEDEVMQLPASEDALYELFESYEEGSSKKLKTFLASAKYKYEVGMNEFVQKPSLSITEFFDPRIISSSLKLQMFTPISKEIRSLFKNKKLIELLEFPVLFLGATPQKIPALYSLMNYADLKLGTWYPIGGMHKIVEGMAHIAIEQGVKFKLNSPVEKIIVEGSSAVSIQTNEGNYSSDSIVSTADYHHTETMLLDSSKRSYTDSYWDKRVMAPSSLLYYLGINKKISGLKHHNLFFDKDFGLHAEEIYTDPKWPTDPLFYVCCPSKTDTSVAPEGMENIFLLIPLAPGISDTEELREKYFQMIMKRLEARTGENILPHIIHKKSYCINNFKKDYNAFKGNAYGLANTLMQTAFLKPRMKSKKINNLYYAGQLTTPGPGVPPSIVSGEVVARLIAQKSK